MNESELISEAMRVLGKRTSPRKKLTSAKNIEKARAKRLEYKELTNKMKKDENKA